jgi:peptidoglycan/xylan/chitin deacetylase (PgdA/CDA1 family)
MPFGRGYGHAGALAMHVAYASGATALARRLNSGHGCLLTFHRVVSEDLWPTLPNRDFHIDAAYLATLLDYLLGTGWAVVSMDEVVSRIRDGDTGRFVNFSIDDVYRDTAETAVPIFRSRNLPVTLFVTTGIPDHTMSMWTCGLETILWEQDKVTLEDGSTVEIGGAAKKRLLFKRLSVAWEGDSADRRYAQFCALNGYASDVLRDRHAVTWKMLDDLRDDPCVEIGGHTMSHPRLSALSNSEARSEIVGCRARLQERLRLPVRHFAFPFGRKKDCGERDFALARAAGFDTAATTQKGLVGAPFRDRLHALRRNTLNGAHRHTSLAETHLSGLGGLVARGLRST